MITGTRKRRGAASRAIAAAGAVLAALALVWGCGGKGEEKKTTGKVRYEPPREYDRELNPTEMDTLRAIRDRYGVTRDEYWADYGGVLANAFIEAWYPRGKLNVLGAAGVLEQMSDTRREAEKLFGRVPGSRLVVVCCGNLEVFRATTGRDWWNYSLIRGDTLTLQAPIDLHTRGLFPMVAQREYYEWAIGMLSAHRVPRWVEEGFASHLSKEGTILEDQTAEYSSKRPLQMSTGAMEAELAREKERIETRRAYYNAYRMAEHLVQTRGRPAVAAFVIACGEEKDLEAASKRAFGIEYNALVDEARKWPEGAGK